MAGALTDVLPLAPTQEGLLFHALLGGTGPDVYQVQARFRIDGPVDVRGLRDAVDALLVRHPNLRACFRHLAPDRPVQVVPRRAAVPWTEVDLPGVGSGSGPGSDEFLRRLLEEDRARRFDVARPPLMRATLVHVGPDRAELVLTMHHILVDGWSMAILAGELTELYRGRAAALPPAPRYRDYLGWLGRQDAGAASGAWRGALAGVRPTRLSTTPAAAQQVGPLLPEDTSLELDAGTTARLRRRAADTGVTLNTLVQAAWALVLGRATDSGDVVFGAVVSGRPSEVPGVESMVGLLINTVPVRVRLPAGDSVRCLLRRLQDEQSALSAHHHLPLARIQRATGTGELFDTVLAFESFPQPAGTVVGSGPRLVEVADATHYPLTLTVLAEQRLRLRLSHRPDRLTRTEVGLLARRLVRALQQLSGDSTTPLGRIDVLDEAERAIVLHRRADPRPQRGAMSIPQQFEAQAARTPHRVAVRCAGRCLTYAQLARRARDLATGLAAAGVTAETTVGLLLERSVELVAAQLAVLQVGGCYLPLEATQPAARLSRLLRDSGARIVVAAQAPAWLPDGVRWLPAHATGDPVTAGHAPVRPDQAAYVMYTSGSTGAPKGVVATHRNVLDLVTDTRFQGEAHRSVLLHSPHTFDAATFEVWVPLLTGGTVVVAAPGAPTPDLLEAQLIDGRVTALWLTAELFHTVADVAPRSLSGLSEVWAGGDVLDPGAVRMVQDSCPRLRVVNGYGPTEATTFATAHPTPRPAPQAPVPIGVPLDGTRAYVLDHRLRPAPVGCAGELYLAGAGLARGYLGQPARTAERFVADPYAPAGGERMYRTGDRARCTSEGVLEFLGRRDAQVKIRGHRVEPGEVEAVLAACPAAHRAVVAARPDGAGGVRLVAYVVLRPDSDLAAVRAHAREHLPRYLLPADYVRVAQLPQGTHGKVDRAALPEPSPPTRVRAAPRTPRQDTLCRLFAAVLGRPEVGPDEDFFDLGGHSLLTVRLAAAIKEELHIRLPLSALFDASTPAALDRRLEDSVPDLGLAPLLTLREGSRTPLFCLHPGMGFGWTYTRLLPHLPAGTPVYALQSPALNGAGSLPETIEQVAEDYVRRITAVRGSGPYLLLGRSFGGLLAYQLAVLLRARGERVGLVGVLDAVPRTGPVVAPDGAEVEQETLRVLLRSGGAPAPEPAARLERADVFTTVRAANGPLHGWSTRLLSAAADVCARNIELAYAYRPPSFDGRVSLFTAGADVHGPSSSQKAAAWRGSAVDVRVHELDCTHSQMLQPHAVAAMSTVLEPVFREL